LTTDSRRYLYFAIAFAVAAATRTSSNARLAASPGQPPSEQTAAADISAKALAQIEALIREKDFRSDAQQKIDSQLISELRMELGQPIAAGVLVAETDLPYAADGHVVVDVKARVTDGLIARLTALGIEVLSSDPDGGMLRVHINIDQVEALAALPDVSFVQPKQEAQIHQAAPNVLFTQTGQGSRSSQGDITHLAYAARAAFGANGTGIKIGVLSDGVTNLATSQASGDLGPVTVLPGQTGSGDEGTAMLEIIHDLAPGAQLYFATAFTSITSFANNIRALRAAGCDIIVDDVAYFVETPFQDGQAGEVISNTNGGVVIQAVNDVTADGALYFSSAGNSGHLSAGTSGTWEGDFVDGGATPSLANLTSGRLHSFGPQNFTAITTPAASAPTNLSWSDPLGGSANDYDLFRLNIAGTAVVASSTNIQSGSQDPYEQLNSPGIAGERIVIVKKSTATTRFLHLGTNRGVLSIATAGETHGHAAAAAAFDVAATPAVGPFPQPFNSTNVVETFSSDGPRRVFFEANGSPYTAGNSSSTGGVLRQKPDITAADGVSVTGAGGFPSSFFGTSAAAPHAAAIAGLLKSAHPSLTPAEIRTLLTTSAIDIGAAGDDSDSGAGIVMADALMRAAGVPGTALLEMTTVEAVDNPGNGNGAPEAGEGVRLVIPLANYGGAPAIAVSATLTSSTPGITITQPATRTYPDLAISASGSATPYLFTAASDFPCPQPASFTLTVTSAGGLGPRVFSFQVPIGPPSYSITTTLDTSAPPGSPGVTTATGLQTARLTRNGVASSCSVTKAAPALFDTARLQFDAYAFNTCSNSVPSCVTVTLQGTNAINLFSASYSPTFVPDNLQQNYKADAGASGSSRSYAFNLAGGAQTFVVDVHQVDSGLGIGAQYTLNVAGACGGACTPNHVPVAIARDVTVPADASGTAGASIDNGSSDADGDPLTITQSPAGPYLIGQTTVLLTVSDPKGATSQATATVTVVGPTTTIVSASPNPSFAAQPVAFTATVTTSSGGFPTDGSVTFQEGSTVLAGPTSLSGGQASFSTSSLSVGAHTITAFYSSASGAFVASNGSIVVTIAIGVAPVITTSPASQTIAAGETATLRVEATGTAPLSYQWYGGTSPSTTTPIAAATASTFTTPALTSATSYWVRVSNPYGTADSATATITIGAAPVITTSPSIAVSATSVAATATVFATVANGPGNRTDWVALYAVGASTYLDWKYLNGSQLAPAVALTGAAMPFTLPTVLGDYTLKFYTGSTLLATSATITVAATTLSVSATTLTPGGTVTAMVSNGPGNAKDWVGIYTAGGATLLDWKYLNGSQTASLTGVSSAAVDLTMPTTPGTYTVRLYFNGALLAESAVITVGVAANPTVTPSTTTVTPGGIVTATIADGPGNARDWVALSAAGDSTYLDWRYLNGTQVVPATGVTGAAVPFTMPMTQGTYILRFYTGSTLLATSATITVATASNTTLTVNTTLVAPGATVTATVANGPGARTDWIAVYPEGASAYVSWKYLNGTQSTPATGLTSAVVDMAMPIAPGNYTLRLFTGNTLVATSATVSVTGSSIDVSATTVAPGGTVAATVVSGPGNRTDWVGLYASDSSTYLEWKYLNATQVAPAVGVTGATVPFTMPLVPGTYAVRFFTGSTLMATSAVITVGGDIP
jgi:hypothetical protein